MIWTIQMQIQTIPRFKKSNANSNHSKVVRSIWMQIRTIWKWFEGFECKCEPFERDSKHSIRTILNWFEWFEWKFKATERDSKHLKAISNHSKWIWTIRMQNEPFERDSKNSNAKFNHSKGIQSIWMQIQTLWPRF